MSPEEQKQRSELLDKYYDIIVIARHFVPEVRLGHATNDICIVAVIKDVLSDGYGVQFKGSTREIVKESLQEHFPELKHSIELLSTPVAPDGFLLCLFASEAKVYVAEIACLNETGGVLN